MYAIHSRCSPRERSSEAPRRSSAASAAARFAARVVLAVRLAHAQVAHVLHQRLAVLEVVKEHVHLAAVLDGLHRVAAEAAADGVGDDREALAELVDEAEGELAYEKVGK